MPTRSTSKIPSKRIAARKARSPLVTAIVEGLQAYAAHKRGDLQLRTVRHFVPQGVDVRALRESLGLSQTQFAGKYGFSARTLQEWEQGRTKPDTAVVAYLNLIQKRPSIVEEVMG